MPRPICPEGGDTKPTTGAFKASTMTMSKREWASLNDGSSLHIVLRGPDVVAVVWDADDREDVEKKANAALLSAAPDLLDALQEIISYRGGAESSLEDEYVMQRVNDAIAKAKGR